MNYEIRNIIFTLETILKDRTFDSYADNIQIAIDKLLEIDIPEKETNNSNQVDLFEFKDFSDGLSIVGYSGFEENITIPDVYNGKKITRISMEAFRDCLNLKNISLGKYIDVIESEAFYGCANLQSVKIQSELLFIGEDAFRACRNLQDINLPNSINFIGKYAFWGTAISTVNIPYNLSFLSECVFAYCENLKQVFLHNNIIAIGEEAFKGCISLKEIVLPPSVEFLYDKAFSMCTSLEDIHIYNSTVHIDWDVFYYFDSSVEDDYWSVLDQKTLPNLTIYCTPKSNAQNFCKKHLIKMKQLANLNFVEPSHPSKISDVIGFTFSKNRKTAELLEMMNKYNLVTLEKYGGEFIFTSNIIEESKIKPFKIMDYLENKTTKCYTREIW